ncbi:MAG: PAS domain S-box protein, partial [Sulfurimonas sp.]|nr:PAS domain S-box protein [Sulfurimonas sp.]
SSNQLIDITFSNIGYNCFNAFTLQEARELLKKHTIHYLMLDINLPDGNGFELIKELGNTSEKIFVLTGETDMDFIHTSFQKGVIDFIAKGKYFSHKINKITNTKKQLEENRYKTVLIIDANTQTQKELKNLLENRNYSIELASNEKTALEIIDLKTIDLMLIDTKLENESGIDFLQKYEEKIIIQDNIPVMLTTENTNSLIIRDGLKSGAVDIIKKPYIIEEIILKVDLWIDYKSKEEEALYSAKLLEEYKEAVDESSIVSKTNPKGIITYANNKFCEISGYSEKDLIGKNHNILRHPDMSSSAFEDMWHTIKDLKKTWKGKVKNRKKDGSYYWVDALVKPILDINGNITEYIGLRNDITETENYKKILKDTIDDKSKSLDENINYISQYEEANSKFTAILKTDTNNLITYVNDMFCELSGYTLEELVGMNCQEFRHENHIKTGDCKKLEETLSKNEYTSRVFTNIAKNSSLYFMDTIVYPITDINGKTIEHLHLMHDITELTNLHKEIEETQKEIVYKMGEIGESRSKETGNHVKRVAEYSKTLAKLYGLSEYDCDTLFTASPMHDIGKVAIADT